MAEFIDSLQRGSLVRVVLPSDVAPWWSDELGAEWEAQAVYVNGDSVDVTTPAGGTGPVDAYHLRPPAPRSVAALYVDPRGPYAGLGVDCWDATRDATAYPGPHPVVAHPPCGPWSRLRQFCGPALLAQQQLGPIAVDQVRRWGGVLEHPAHSALWSACQMPRPGELPDAWGGWTLAVEQWRWGHRAIKPTWLYIVGTREPPPLPAGLQERPAGGNARGLGDRNRSMLERLPKTQRHITPPGFARWLVELASGCRR